jgi:hypothetical protein
MNFASSKVIENLKMKWRRQKEAEEKYERFVNEAQQKKALRIICIALRRADKHKLLVDESGLNLAREYVQENYPAALESSNEYVKHLRNELSALNRAETFFFSAGGTPELHAKFLTRKIKKEDELAEACRSRDILAEAVNFTPTR